MRRIQRASRKIWRVVRVKYRRKTLVRLKNYNALTKIKHLTTTDNNNFYSSALVSLPRGFFLQVSVAPTLSLWHPLIYSERHVSFTSSHIIHGSLCFIRLFLCQTIPSLYLSQCRPLTPLMRQVARLSLLCFCFIWFLTAGLWALPTRSRTGGFIQRFEGSRWCRWLNVDLLMNGLKDENMKVFLHERTNAAASGSLGRNFN